MLPLLLTLCQFLISSTREQGKLGGLVIKWNIVATGVCSGHKLSLFGAENLWKCDWENTGRKARIQDPLYKVYKEFDIFRVKIGCSSIEFAAGEFSNDVWGFYILDN